MNIIVLSCFVAYLALLLSVGVYSYIRSFSFS